MLREVMRLLVFFVVLSAPVYARETLVTLTDATGDDYGDGALTYPQRADYQPGDLDLTQFKIERDDRGFWFEVTFANPIRDPATTSTGAGKATQNMAHSARRGFYSFNIDIYIDTDRQANSGNQFSVPGRRARIDPAFAWERAVLLTPRPELMRTALVGALEDQYPDRSIDEAEAMIDQTLFFPKEVKVLGRRLAFFVPQEFFGPTRGNDWAITAFVTGAKPFENLGMSFLPSAKTPLERLDMGVMQPAPGSPEDSFGYPSMQLPLPIVDLLAPSTQHQTGLLSGDWPLTGVSWGPHAQSVVSKPIGTARLSRNVPDGESFFNDPLGSIRRLWTDERTPNRAAVGEDAARRYLDPAQQGKPASAPGRSDAAVKPDVPTRMKALKHLLDEGLISQADYEQQKKRLLGDL